MNFNVEMAEETVAMDAVDDFITGLCLGITVASLFFCE